MFGHRVPTLEPKSGPYLTHALRSPQTASVRTQIERESGGILRRLYDARVAETMAAAASMMELPWKIPWSNHGADADRVAHGHRKLVRQF